MSDAAIRLQSVGKMYKLFRSRRDNLLDALGIDRVMPWRRSSYREFWALRDVDLELLRSERVGIIGRNGAGKTTLLKLITGNISPTEGQVSVDGSVQALLESGGGLHPDFTGRENIHAALTYQGLDTDEIAAAEDEIADFTELEGFLDQPFKTYSLGMQARLAFAISTTVRPEILIVDEVLGAGDAYFFGKSISRMRTLVESGASVLIVSHALDQILRFCEQAIWIDRGRIVMRGPSLEVVKSYEEFVRELEERRLSAKNWKIGSAAYNAGEWDTFADSLVVRLVVSGDRGGACDVSQLRLLRGDGLEEEIRVGDPQDVDSQQSAFVVDSDAWSRPQREGDRSFRRVSVHEAARDVDFVFNLFALVPDSDYALEIVYRTQPRVDVDLQVFHDGARVEEQRLPTNGSHWTSQRIRIQNVVAVGKASTSHDGAADGSSDTTPGNRRVRRKSLAAAARKWPGQGTLTIERAHLVGGDDRKRSVFEAHTPLSLHAEMQAHADEVYSVIPAAVLYRLDGVLVSRFIGDRFDEFLRAGERLSLRLDLGDLNLGNGNYVFALALYHSLDRSGVEPPELYDLIDRSYEFQVIGVPALETAIFEHPGVWSVE